MAEEPSRPMGRSRGALVGTSLAVSSPYNLLRATMRTFNGNSADVDAAISRLVADLVMTATRDEAATAVLNREVGRTFFNWLCSVHALVEHTRSGVIPVLKSGGAPLVPEYDARRAALSEPSLRMVRELRNYAVHHSLPVVFSSLRHSRSAPLVAKVFLGVHDLRASTRWTAPVRDYLTSLNGDIELRPLISSYAGAVDVLYSWLGPTTRAWVQAQIEATGSRMDLREWGE